MFFRVLLVGFSLFGPGAAKAPKFLTKGIWVEDIDLLYIIIYKNYLVNCYKKNLKLIKKKVKKNIIVIKFTKTTILIKLFNNIFFTL